MLYPTDWSVGWRPVAIGGSTIVLAELNVGMYRGNTTPPYNFVKVASNLFGASVSCVNIIYVPELHVFIGAGTDGKVYQSVNDGNNWSAVGSYGASGGYVPRMRFKNGYLYVASSNSGLVIYSIESGPIPARPATGRAHVRMQQHGRPGPARARADGRRDPRQRSDLCLTNFIIFQMLKN